MSEKKNEGEACGCGGTSCFSRLDRWIWIILALAVAGVLIVKHAGKKPAPTLPAAGSPPAVVTGTVTVAASEPATQGKALPRLVDLGAGKCIPCKMMAPILEDLKTTYAGKIEVQFIDVWENKDAGKEYGINVIPTQIFYNAAGKELFRHEGFLAKEDILKKWKELGVDLSGPAN